MEALREDLLELEATLLPALRQMEGLDEGGVIVASWVSGARGGTQKEVGGAAASKKGLGKKGKAAAATSAAQGMTNHFRGSERERCVP